MTLGSQRWVQGHSMAQRGGSFAPSDLNDEELRGWIAALLRTMMARRVAVQDRHAMLRELRLEMQQVLVQAPITYGDLGDAVTFRARLNQALELEIAAAEADITADYRHLPGIRN